MHSRASDLCAIGKCVVCMGGKGGWSTKTYTHTQMNIERPVHLNHTFDPFDLHGHCIARPIASGIEHFMHARKLHHPSVYHCAKPNVVRFEKIQIIHDDDGLGIYCGHQLWTHFGVIQLSSAFPAARPAASAVETTTAIVVSIQFPLSTRKSNDKR